MPEKYLKNVLYPDFGHAVWNSINYYEILYF